MSHRRRRSSGGGGSRRSSRSRSRSAQRSQSRNRSRSRARSRSRGAQRSQSKRRSQQRTQQREQRANVREQARSAPQRAAQRAAKARAAAPSYLAGLQAAGGLSGTQGAGAGQANRLANEYGQKGTTDARKREIAKELKGVRRQLNVDNRRRAYDSLNLGKTNKGLVMRTSDGSIIRDSSGNPILSSAGKDAFDQTRQGYSDRSEYLRQTNPELYNRMYPVAGAAMNIIPAIIENSLGGRIIKGIGQGLKGGADKVKSGVGNLADSSLVSDAGTMISDLTGGLTGGLKSGIGSFFNRFQNDQGSTAGPDMSPQGGGGQGGGGQTSEGGFPQAETSWAGIYNRLISQGLTPVQAKQRMAEMGQSGGLQTFGPIPQQFRLEIENVLKPSEGVVGGIPGISQPIRKPSAGYGGSIGRPGARTGDFRDSDGDGIDDRDQQGPGMPNMVNPGGFQKMQPPITAQLLSGQANTPANAMAAFNQMQPMSTQQLSFSPQQPLSQAPGGLAQFSSMLNRFS
jgi:hypothetical protein